MHAARVLGRFYRFNKILARIALTSMLFIGCSAETAMAASKSGSFSSSTENGTPNCGTYNYNLLQFFPTSDGVSCSYKTHTFTPDASGELTITITPSGENRWGRQGWPTGTPGMFAFLSTNSDPMRWNTGNPSFDASQVSRSIPVSAGTTYYLHVGYGTWANCPCTPITGPFTVNYTIPAITTPEPPYPDDVPLPFWAIFTLGAGFISLVYRKSRRFGNPE